MTKGPGKISADGETAIREAGVARPNYERFSPGDVLDERYRIIALLGKGGMGEVYRADDLKLGQQVALPTILSIVAVGTIVTSVLFRFGLLAGFVMSAMMNLTIFPLTWNTEAFFFPSSAIVFVFIFGFLAWGALASIDVTPQHAAPLESFESL